MKTCKLYTTMRLRILHTADLHLGASFNSFEEKSNDLKNETTNNFIKIVEYAINPENSIDVVIIAGDIFDTYNPEKNIVELVKNEFNKIIDKGILLLYIPGNHDSYGYQKSIYRKEKLPGNLILNDTFSYYKTFNIKKFTLHIYSGIFNPGKNKPRILKDFSLINENGFHLGILHGTYENGKFEGIERNLPFNLEEFKKSNLNYLALGHFHSHFEINIDNSHKAIYPGSIIPRKINEYGEKSITLLEIDENNNINVERLKLFKLYSKKLLINLAKENINDIEELFNFILKNKNSNMILDLYIEGFSEFPINEKELKNHIEEYFYYVKINIDNLNYIESSTISNFLNEETIRSLYFKKLLSKKAILSDYDKKIINRALNLGLQYFTGNRNEN